MNQTFKILLYHFDTPVCSVQFSLLTDLVVCVCVGGGGGGTRDDSTGILSQSFLQEALVSSSGMGSDVHSLMLSIQHSDRLPNHTLFIIFVISIFYSVHFCVADYV